eukprot:TRINITY_DN2403_c0_g1_i2.p1 TRINITY_DN2403_c0_g1~~TRINITY_DN2403_c0_g1_i2.p1  ORF type:complete len:185 (-),score=12.72 TRINITY_DN2403_c0_g1_i2:40-594(-)
MSLWLKMTFYLSFSNLFTIKIQTTIKNQYNYSQCPLLNYGTRFALQQLMNIKNELKKIAGYPEILKHIVEVSEIVNISIKGDKSYCFTVSLDNHECINVSKACSDLDYLEIFQDIQTIREILLIEVEETKQIMRNQMCNFINQQSCCLLYTSDAADDTPCVDLGGRRIIKKKKNFNNQVYSTPE